MTLKTLSINHISQSTPNSFQVGPDINKNERKTKRMDLETTNRSGQMARNPTRWPIIKT